MTYDDLSKLVNDAYRETGDIRETMVRTGLTFGEVWDMTGMKDWSLAGYQREYVEEAKRRSLTPDACRIMMTIGENPSSWSNLSLCREALNWRGTGWITAKDKRPFLEEIEKRGLSPKLCRGYVTRAN